MRRRRASLAFSLALLACVDGTAPSDASIEVAVQLAAVLVDGVSADLVKGTTRFAAGRDSLSYPPLRIPARQGRLPLSLQVGTRRIDTTLVMDSLVRDAVVVMWGRSDSPKLLVLNTTDAPPTNGATLGLKVVLDRSVVGLLLHTEVDRGTQSAIAIPDSLVAPLLSFSSSRDCRWLRYSVYTRIGPPQDKLVAGPKEVPCAPFAWHFAFYQEKEGQPSIDVRIRQLEPRSRL